MENFKSAVGATEAALDSEGSAATENAKRMDSLQGKVTQLKSAWQEFARDTINSDFIKNILTATTNMVKFVDSIGGIKTLLPVLTSLVAILNFDKITSELKGIKTTFDSVIGIIKLLKTTSSETGMSMVSVFTKVAGSATLLKGAIGLVGAAISIGIALWQKHKQAIEEASDAAIKNSNSSGENAKKKEEEVKSEEKQIEKLKEEQQEYLKNADAKDISSDSSKAVREKQKEINKRQENIDKMKEEIEQDNLTRKASARSFHVEKVSSPGVSLTEGTGKIDPASLNKINNQLKEAEGNTGAYQRKLQELIKDYEKQRENLDEVNKRMKQFGGNSVDLTSHLSNYDEIIRILNNELNENSKANEENADVAESLYNMAKDGINISDIQLESGENALEFMQEYYGLNNDQIEQLKQGIDVKAQDVEATDKQSESQNTLSEATRNAQEQEDKARQALNDMSSDIDTYQESMDKMKSAVDEYNESGYLSIDNLQNLLSLDSSYLSMLDMENGKLVLNTQAMDTMVNALIKKKQEELQSAAITDIWAIANDGAASSANLAAAAAKTAGEDAKNSGDKAKQGAPGWLEYAAAVERAAAAAGADKDEETKKRIQQRLDEYKSAAKTIGQLGASFGNGGYSSGSGHKYTGSGKSKKSGSGSGSKSKSQKEEYKATIDTLYNYKNALDIAKDSVDKLQDALKNTDNYEEQEKYIRQLISALNDEINKTNDLKAAQTRQINDYINQLRAQGFAIDYNANKNTLYINNMQHLADFSGDTAKSLEKMIDKIQDLNKDNIKLDGSVRDLTKDTKDYNEQLEKLPEEKLKKFKELLEDFQQSRLDQVKNQKEDLEYQKKSDQRIKALEKQIDAIEKQNDELDKQEEINEKILEVEEAKEKLANAQRERNIQVYTERGLTE